MDAGAPQQPDDDQSRRGHRARLAVWCQVAGAVLALATLACSLLGVISAQQAIALGLPAALLIVGGVIVTAGRDLPAACGSGFRAGLRTGTLLSRLRSWFRRGAGGLAAPSTRRSRLRR